MKSRYGFLILVVAATLALGACGKKEEPAAEAPKPAAPAATVDPATAATITGTVKLDGAAPKAKRINMGAEPSCAAKHTTPQMTEEVITGEGGALANVVVYVKEGLKGAAPAATEKIVLNQEGCIYKPHVMAVQVNQPIEILNSDPTTHNIHPTPAVNREWNESQPQGASPLNKSFAREEVAIPVKCNVHPWMKSYIAVLGHPYFKVTGSSGAFEIKNLPPGDYTLVAWHEKFGESEPQKVTVAAKESKAVDFVFRAASGD
jgi:plastocyanin